MLYIHDSGQHYRLLLKMRYLVYLICVSLLCGAVLPAVVVHVASNGKDVPECVGGNATSPCKTLEYVTQELKLGQITNNVNILIDTDINLQGVGVFQSLKNITITGEDISVHCVCNAAENTSDNCGMVFENSSNIVLDSVSIYNCSNMHNTLGDEYRYRSAVVFNGSTNIRISNVKVSNSYGYGVVITHATSFINISHSHFTNNSLNKNTLFYGGAGLLIYMTSCPPANKTCSLNQTTHIDIHIKSSNFIGNTLELLNQSSFWLLSYGGGLSVIFHWGTVGNTIRIIDSNFIGNKAASGGGAMVICNEACYNNKLLIERVTFEANGQSSTPQGGSGLSVGLDTIKYGDFRESNGNNFTIVSSIFKSNYGVYGAGTLVFIGAKHNNAHTVDNTIAFTNCTYRNNTAGTGAAIEIVPDFLGYLGEMSLATPIFHGCQLLSNHITKQHYFHGKYPYSYYQAYGIFLVLKHSVIFSGNTVFEKNNGSALFLTSSSARLKQGANMTFNSNQAEQGAAIAITGASFIYSEQDTYWLFSNNHATLYGGAICVLNTDDQIFLSQTCFSTCNQTLYEEGTLKVTYYFDNNSAGSGLGNSIFMTSINSCKQYCSHHELNSYTLHPFNNSCIGNYTYTNNSNQIATSAKAINVTKNISDVIPGHEFLLPIKAIDDLDQDVTNIMVYKSSVVSRSTEPVTINPAFNYVTNNTLVLHGEAGSRGDIVLADLGFHGTVAQIPISLAACPPGYVITSKSNLMSCTCSVIADKNKRYHGIRDCREEFTVHVAYAEPDYWVGYITNDTEEANENNLYTSDCPFAHCKTSFNKETTLGYYSLTSKASKRELEEQVCNENRKGIMCSKCKDGYSVYYHSPTVRCADNSQCALGALFYVLSELLPITFLFISILWLDISLTSGTAYSIIFMVQIVQSMNITINGAVQLNPPILQDIYTVAYNSLNIDFFYIDKLSFCLWAGAGTLDMLAMKYASVLFSVILIGLFVFLSNHCNSCIRKLHCSTRHSVLQGFTAFIAICYSQCTQITFLLLDQVTPRGIGGKLYHTVVFWDGSIAYFSVQHLMYAIPAIICLVVVVIPFPLVLLLDGVLIKIESYLGMKYQFIQRIHPWTILHVKVKPLLDSFQGCFKDKYRFFSGMFYIYRIVIIILIPDLTPSVKQFYFNLEIALVIIFTVQAFFQPFQKKHHNQIATVIFCNLAVINALTIGIYLSIQYGKEAQMLQWIQLILIYIPLFVAVMWAVHKLYKYGRFRYSMRKASKMAEYEAIDDFPEKVI